MFSKSPSQAWAFRMEEPAHRNPMDLEAKLGNQPQCNIRAPWVRLMRHGLPWISSKTKSKTKYYKGGGTSSVSCFGPFAWRPIISWSRLQPDLNFLWLQALTQHKFNTSIQQKLQPFKLYLPGSSNVTSSKAQFPLFGEQLAWECRDLESNLRATSRVCAKVHSWHNAKRALCIQDGPGRTIAATEFVGNCVPRLHKLSLSHLDSSEKKTRGLWIVSVFSWRAATNLQWHKGKIRNNEWQNGSPRANMSGTRLANFYLQWQK